MSFGPTVFDCDAVAFDIAEFRKPFAEGSYKWPIILARSLVKEANGGSCRLLRGCHERPRCRAAEQRDEVAASAEQRDEFTSFHCPGPPVLPTGRIAHLRTAGVCCIHPTLGGTR